MNPTGAWHFAAMASHLSAHAFAYRTPETPECTFEPNHLTARRIQMCVVRDHKHMHTSAFCLQTSFVTQLTSMCVYACKSHTRRTHTQPDLTTLTALTANCFQHSQPMCGVPSVYAVCHYTCASQRKPRSFRLTHVNERVCALAQHAVHGICFTYTRAREHMC